jgi:hypothetical protein
VREQVSMQLSITCTHFALTVAIVTFLLICKVNGADYFVHAGHLSGRLSLREVKAMIIVPRHLKILTVKLIDFLLIQDRILLSLLSQFIALT